MARSRSRRVVWTLVVLLVLGAVGAGAVYLIRRGRGSNDPFRRAVAAQQAGDLDLAESRLRAILDDDPAHERARYLLLHVLATARRFDAARDVAGWWRERPLHEVKGLRALSEIALQEGDQEGALRLARLVADRDPAFAQSMLMQIQDLRGTPADREGAARSAENLARVASSKLVQAQAFLYAAETLRDLERATTDEGVRAALAARREADRREANLAASTRLGGPGAESMAPAERMALLGRIQLLSSDAEERRQGASKLEEVLAEEPALHAARASLIAYYLDEGAAQQALAHVEPLATAPPTVALRTIGALADAGERDAAMAMLDALTSLPEEARVLMRARILAGGSEDQRREGLAELEELAAAHPDNVALAQEVFARLQATAEPDRALAFLDRLAEANPRLRLAALRERAAQALAAGDQARLGGLLDRLAAAATLADLPGLFVRLQAAGGPKDATAVAFLDRVLAAGAMDLEEVRLLRASVTASRPGDAADGRPWAEHARDDLEALAAGADASAELLVRAAATARASDETDLVGVLLGRALASPTDGKAALEPYLRLVGEGDAGLRQVAAQGLREAGGRDPSMATWIDHLASALVAGDASRLRRTHGESPVVGAPADTESALQMLLASRAKDWPEAEAIARERLASAAEIDKERAQAHLGAVLLDAGKPEEVLALHGGDSLPASLREQRVWALQRLGRGLDAVAEARQLVAEAEGGDRALVVLAQVLSTSNPDAALAAAAAAPGSLEGAFLRADLLERRGEDDAALVVMEDLLRASQNRNMAAWQGLTRMLTAAGRGDELVERLSAALDSGLVAARAQDVASLLLMRGQALEQQRSYERALADYRRVLELAKDHPVALNNAAWLISSGLVRGDPADEAARQEEALALVDRAVRVAPSLAPLHHTRAKILKALSRHEDALPAFDQAIQLYQAQPVPEATDRKSVAQAMSMRARLAGYMLDKADLLADMERGEAARALYEKIVDAYPRTYPGTEAAKALAGERR